MKQNYTYANISQEKKNLVLISKIFYVILDVDIYLDNKVTRFYLKVDWYRHLISFKMNE